MKSTRIPQVAFFVLPLALATAGFVVGSGMRDSTAIDAPRADRSATANVVGVDIEAGVALDPLVQAGLGESLVLVIGGVYEPEADAQEAAARTDTEVEGFQVARMSDFAVLHVYREMRPAREIVECSDAALRQAESSVEELAGLSIAEILEECRANGRRDVEVVTNVDLSPGSPCLTTVECIPVDDEVGDQWLTVSAFRTLRGAEEFMTYLREMAGVEDTLAMRAIRVNGSSEIGLGQEAHPDGHSGPLLLPLDEQVTYQR